MRSSRAFDAAADALRRSPARSGVQRWRHRGVRPADVFLASYPRSGNTWLRYLLADLLTGAPADFVSIDRIWPVVGAQGASTPRLTGAGRPIKTHEPYRGEYRRALYLVRDPRDVVISWYALLTPDPSRLAGLDAFVTDFVRGRVAGYGSWQDHVRGWTEAAERTEGIRIDRFERIRADTLAFVAEACGWFGIDASRDQIEEAVARNSLERMRALEAQNIEYLKSLGWRSQGVREGRVGTWREVLTERHMRELRPALEVAGQLGYDV